MALWSEKTLDIISVLLNLLRLSLSHACLQSCPILCNPMDCSPPGSSVHGDSPGKNTRVGCHFLLQGVFPTQESNLRLLHWQAGYLPLVPPGKPIWCRSMWSILRIFHVQLKIICILGFFFFLWGDGDVTSWRCQLSLAVLLYPLGYVLPYWFSRRSWCSCERGFKVSYYYCTPSVSPFIHTSLCATYKGCIYVGECNILWSLHSDLLSPML